jgi:hypothetical protein
MPTAEIVTMFDDIGIICSGLLKICALHVAAAGVTRVVVV